MPNGFSFAKKSGVANFCSSCKRFKSSSERLINFPRSRPADLKASCCASDNPLINFSVTAIIASGPVGSSNCRAVSANSLSRLSASLALSLAALNAPPNKPTPVARAATFGPAIADVAANEAAMPARLPALSAVDDSASNNA